MKKIILLIIISILVFSCSEKAEQTAVQADAETVELSGFDGTAVGRDMSKLVGGPSKEVSDEGYTREGFDLSATTVNYFSADALDTADFVIEDDGRSFEITDFGPDGQLPRENRKPVIYVTFSHAMVPVGKLGAPLSVFEGLSISPELKGTYHWYGTRTLSFEPDELLQSQQEYTVTVSSDLQSLGKKSLAVDFSFSFKTEPLDIAGMRPGTYDRVWDDFYNVPPEFSQHILLSFTEPVDPVYIKSFIKIRSGQKDFSFRVSRPESEEQELDENYISRTLQLELDEAPPFDSDINVVLEAGAASAEGKNGRPGAVFRKYHTLKPFRFVSESTYSYAFPRSRTGTINPVFIEMSQPVNSAGAIDLISTSFGVIEDWADKVEIWENIIRINDLPVEYGKNYEVVLKAGLSDIYGQELQTDRAVEIYVPEASPYAYFPGGSVYRDTDYNFRMLESQFAPKVIYEYQNISEGQMAVNPVSNLYSNIRTDLTPVDFADSLKNEANYKILDLSPWLNEDGFGSVQLNWNFVNPSTSRYKNDYRQNLVVQVTDLGVTVRYAYNTILVWVNSLTDGEPVAAADVSIKVGGSDKTMLTDADGLAVFKLTGYENKNVYSSRYHSRFSNPLTVTVNGDRADFLPSGTHSAWHFGVYSGAGPWAGNDPEPVTFFFTDRGLYRPGETLTFRGIDRDIRLGDFESYTGDFQLNAKKQEWRAKPFNEITGSTTTEGGFYGKIDLPEDLEPGTYQLAYKRSGGTGETRLTFEIANFRRLNFEVSSKVPQRLFIQGDTVSVPVKASYLAGGAMANADYSYFWTRQPAWFHPEGEKYSDWVFGPDHSGGTQNLTHKAGKLNASGEVRAEQETGDETIEGQPFRYVLETKVEDIDRQEVSSRASVLVHPGSYYIGARLTSGSKGWWSRFVAEDTEQTAEFILVDPEGGEVSAEAEIIVELIQRSWVTAQQQGVYGRINTRYTLVEKVVDTQTVKHSGGTSTVKFKPTEAGSYILRSKALDEEGRTIVTDLRLYATGASWIKWANSGADDINLIVDKSLYSVGETARILVQSPLPDGKYLMTVEREGIFEEKIISFEGSTGVIELPITEDHVPVIYVAICSQQERTSTAESYFDPDLGKPKGYFGITAVNVSTATRELDIEVIPDKKIHRPGEQMEVVLKVTKDGKPVADSEMIFLAVDRGVLDLINYHVPNPLTHFYDPDNFRFAVAGDDSRRLLLDPVTYDVSELQGGDGDKLNRREDFVPLAVFEPFLKTDSKGEAHVSFELPDTLTTYRATAIALENADIGFSESEFLVQNPINVRTALPRKLRYRDTTIGGLILQNLDSESHKMTVSIKADGISIGDSEKKSVTVPAESSYEMTWLLMAEQTGTAELVFTVNSDVLNEELVQKLEIETPLVKEAFTTIGSTDTFFEEALVLPSAVQQDFGSLSFQLDSTRMPLIREPLSLLADYRLSGTSFLLPYGYRALPGLLFGDAASKMLPESAIDPEGRAKVYFTRAANYQWSDGGIRMTSGGISSSPRASVQAAGLLNIAKTKGYTSVIPENLDQGKLYKYLSDLAKNEKIPLYFRTRAAAELAEAGRPVPETVRALEGYEDSLGLSGYGYLAIAELAQGSRTKAEEIWGRMKNFLAISTQSVDLEETYEAAGYFDSEIEQLSLILKVAVLMDESDDMVSRLSESIGRRIQAARWLSYPDCEAAAAAFGTAFKDESGEDTDFTASIKISETAVASESFEGISENPFVKELSLNGPELGVLEKNKPYIMRFEKDGKGKLYYTSTIEYALPSEIVQPRDEGLSVYTVIETLDGEEVSADNIVLGETYRCRAFISSDRDRSFLTLSVPVPSGADIIDSTFVTSSSYADEGGVNSEEWTRETVYGDKQSFIAEGTINFEYGGWWMHYYRPEMLVYDNEMIYQWEYFYKGERRVSFLFKATTPGLYPVPPAQASLMLEPEVFGRTGGGLFVIQ